MQRVVHNSDRLVSVIVPVFNSKKYLQRCLRSILDQTHSNLEVIVVDDGSTDGSIRILERHQETDERIRILRQPNSGQGVARNRALAGASGEFILFVDSDDFIEPVTVEIALERILKDDSDFVHFDWKLCSQLKHRPKASNYFNIQNFWHDPILEGSDCDRLMDTVSFFTVNNLYRKSFLKRHGIRYGEGYIYEDIPFFAQATTHAERVSLVHSPLYVIQPNPTSTTQSEADTSKHYRGHITALKASMATIRVRDSNTVLYLLKYNLQKFMEYYTGRVPRRFRGEYARAFFDIFAGMQFSPNIHLEMNRYLRFFVERNVFKKRNYNLFRAVIEGRRPIATARDAIIGNLPQKKVIGSRPDTVKRRPAGSIVFLGFDHRYSGNSRYLFEEMRADRRFAEVPIYFVSDDERVPENCRASLDEDLYDLIFNASIVIAESWISPTFPKGPDTLWIQLWHGTPVKKVLFDSHEREIIGKKLDHKVSKHRDIQRWDYLLADSVVGMQKSQSAFLFPSGRLLQGGYPRVKYLLNNRENAALKERIRERLGVPESRRLVLYAPTWRDYNYGVDKRNRSTSHLVDLDELSVGLGDNVQVVLHDHQYMDSGLSSGSAIGSSGLDIQELLLISDWVISDYSSVIFDALAIDVPFLLYANDLSEFEKSRGVYEDVWRDLSPFIYAETRELVAAMHEAPRFDDYQKLKDNYAYRAEVDLLTFIDQLDVVTLNRNW